MANSFGPMTAERKARTWQLWRQGNPMSVIARDIAKPPATIYSYLLYHGGIKPRQRSRRAGCLSLDEREMISRGLSGCKSLRRISEELGRSASTISREVARNGGPVKYRACHAEKAFLKRSQRPKLTLLSQDEELRGVVTELLEADWSPEQIAGWLKRRVADKVVLDLKYEARVVPQRLTSQAAIDATFWKQVMTHTDSSIAKAGLKKPKKWKKLDAD